METTKINLYSLSYSEVRTYVTACVFVAGNIVLPQICHFIPQGGFILLPIYFFTLIAAFKYGWRVGLLTAVFSPLVNSFIFGMPAIAVLPIILIKSTLLALIAGVASKYYNRISIGILTMVVFSYQIIGTLAEWVIVGEFYKAVQDFRIGLMGMALQIVGGYFFIKNVIGKK